MRRSARGREGEGDSGRGRRGQAGEGRGYCGSRSSAKCEEAAGRGMAAASGGAQLPSSKTCAIRMHEQPVEARRMREEDRGVDDRGKAREQLDLELPRSWAPQQSVRAAFDHLTSVPLRTKLNYHRTDGYQGVHIVTDNVQKQKLELQHVNVGAVQTALSPPRRQPPAQTPRRPQHASPHVRTNRLRASPRIQRNAVGAKPAVLSSHRVRKMDRSDKLEAVDHLHEMAKNLRFMRKSFALLSAAKSRAENIKAVLAALKKGFPQLTMSFVLQALGQNEEFPACDGPARIVACGARRFAMSHWAHSESVLAASRNVLTSDVLQCVAARSQEEGSRLFGASLPDSSRLQCVVIRRPGGELAGLICGVAPGWLPDPDEVYLRLILRSAAANLALALRDLHVARHTQTVLGASDWRKRIIDGAACFVRQCIGANSDLWRISYLLRGALRSSITGCLDCIVVFRDMKRDEGFVLLESVPSKGPIYASDGATRVVLDDRTHPETDVLMPCAQVRAKLRVYEKAQCAALKCLRTGKGPLTDPPRTRAADLVQFSMEDLCPEAQNKSWLAQTCMPILTTSDNGVEPLASLCILSEDPLEGLEIDKLEAAALAVTSTLESACKRFVARRARLAASIELQTKIDARRDERAALQAFSDILSAGVAQNPQQIQQHLSECAVSCLATETLPRIWLREDCAALLRDAEVPSESSSARLVALAENDSDSLEKRDLETAFFEPIVLEDATRILVPLIAQPEGDFLGLVESASPLLRSLEERRETNLHSAGGIAAKRWIVHTMHFASIAADLLRAGLLQRHVDFLHGSLRPGVESIRDRLRQVSQEDGGLAALVPSVRDMQVDGMRVAMRYFVVLARALVGAAGASAFAFDNTLDPTDLHEIHNSGLPDALLTNPDALYLQRRLGSTLVLRAIPMGEAQRLVPDRDFDGDLLGATEARRAANEGKADGPAQEEIRTIHTFSDPRKSQGHDALADELSNLRIAASNFVDEDDTPIETSKDDDARPPHANDWSTSRSRYCQSPSTNSLRQADIETQEIRSDVVQPDHAQLHDNANQDKLNDEKDEEMEESKADEDEEEEDEEGDEQAVDSQSTSAVNLLDSLICGVEHQCTRHRPSVSVRVRQSEIESDMALRQRRFWNARAGAILQLSRFRVPRGVDILPGWLEAVRRLGARTDAFSQAEVMVVESLMANAAALWHNLWRCEDLRSMLTRENRIFNMLADVAKLVPPSMPLSETGRALWQLCINLRDLFSCDRVTVLATMANQGTTVLVPIAETSSRHQATSNSSTHASRFLVSIDSKDRVADAARQQRCLSSSALSESEEGSVLGPHSEPAEGGRAYTIWSELCIPLWSPSLKRIVGVIQACNKRPLERDLDVVESRQEVTLEWIESLESFTDVDVRLVRQSGFLPLLTTVLAKGRDLTQLHPRAKQTVRSEESSVSAAAMAQICTKQVVLSRARESFLKGMLRAKQRMERRRQSNTSSMRKRSSSRRISREGLSQEKQNSTHALGSSRDVSLASKDVEQATGCPQTAVGSPSETDLSEEEKTKIRMAKLKEETADGVVPDARKFVRLAVKRFIEDETLRQDRERQTKLHRRKENRDWASMVANTDVQARLLAPSDGSTRGSRLSYKVSPRRRSGIRQNSFVLRRRGNFTAVDEDLNAIKEDSKASKLAMQELNMLMTKDA